MAGRESDLHHKLGCGTQPTREMDFALCPCMSVSNQCPSFQVEVENGKRGVLVEMI